jgi:hypothetical protein
MAGILKDRLNRGGEGVGFGLEDGAAAALISSVRWDNPWKNAPTASPSSQVPCGTLGSSPRLPSIMNSSAQPARDLIVEAAPLGTADWYPHWFFLRRATHLAGNTSRVNHHFALQMSDRL